MADDDCEAWLSQFWQCAQRSRLKVPFFLALHPRLTARAVRNIIRLPYLEARLSDNPEGQIISTNLKRICILKMFRLAGSGTCVLSIPAAPHNYRLGSSKQTLRRKVRAAERAGVTCRIVEDEAEQAELVSKIDLAFATKPNPIYRERKSNHSHLIGSGLWTAAFAQSGEPLVVAVTPRDGAWALLRVFVSLGEAQQHSDARYLLTQAVVERLAMEGVRHLVDTRGPSELPNGLRHFQRMLGFRIARVKLRAVERHRTSNWRRGQTGSPLTTGSSRKAPAEARPVRVEESCAEHEGGVC